MNQPSFKDYKDEVYNIGSPPPDPKGPLKTIKKATASKIPKLKVKLNFTPKGNSSTRKRSRVAEDSDSDLLESPPKKIKMDEKTVELMMEKLSEKWNEKMSESIKAQMEPMQLNMAEMTRTMTGIRADTVSYTHLTLPTKA